MKEIKFRCMCIFIWNYGNSGFCLNFVVVGFFCVKWHWKITFLLKFQFNLLTRRNEKSIYYRVQNRASGFGGDFVVNEKKTSRVEVMIDKSLTITINMKSEKSETNQD